MSDQINSSNIKLFCCDSMCSRAKIAQKLDEDNETIRDLKQANLALTREVVQLKLKLSKYEENDNES